MKSLFHLLLGGVLVLSSCTKFIEVDPPFTSTSTEMIFQKDATAAAALTGIYVDMESGYNIDRPGGGAMAIACEMGLYTDEIAPSVAGPGFATLLFTNSLRPVGTTSSDWNKMYSLIYRANAAWEGLSVSTTLTPAIKQQLMGEARFMRAFLYFYLTNIFDGVPLVLTTDYKNNSLLARTNNAQVMAQVIEDLKQADSLLSPDYRGSDAMSATTERVRPCKAAAEAMLSRAYLYTKEYAHAETYASKVIEQAGSYQLVGLDSIFLMNSKEAIWQAPSVGVGPRTNTNEGRTFIVSLTTNNQFGPDYYLQDTLVNSFELGDLRRTSWIKTATADNGVTYTFPFKYKIGLDYVPQAEYSTILRLSELYLIRAEARAMQNKIGDAQDDLNLIRTRAQLSSTTADNQADLITALVHERQVELFLEWGHRFFDLKRLGLLNNIIGPIKAPNWQTTDQHFPIPQEERNVDVNLTQNDGYQ